MPYNPSQTYRGGEYIASGLSNLGQGIVGALDRYQKMENQRAEADSLMQLLNTMEDPTDPGDPNNPDKPKRTILDSKSYERYLAASGMHKAATAGGMMGALQMYDKMRENASQAEFRREQLGLAKEENKSQAELRQAQAEALRVSPEKERLQLTPEEQEAYTKAGKIPLRVSAGSFATGELPETEAIDVDAQGSPIFSGDESLYRSGGKWKPVTEPMRKAREDYKAQIEAQQKAEEDAAKKAQPGLFERIFGGSKAPPTPAPVAVGAPGAAAVAPSTRVIAPGGKVRVKAPNGQVGLIPAAQLEAAVAAGYTQL